MDQLSERQQKMLEFITKFSHEKGRPPTIREIGKAVGISSTSVVNYNLNILVEKGLIAREKEVSRGLQVVGARLLNAIQIPLLGTIAAGAPIPVPEAGLEPLDTLTFTRDLFADANNLFALKVKGNSMIDALINDGDIVVMQKQETARDGEMVAVWLRDKNETTLKKFYREKGNHVRLQPMNPTMKPIPADARNVVIQGKVVLVVRQLGKPLPVN